MTLSRSLKGSIALVTGAGSGMGKATAEILAAEGAHVAVTDYDATSAQAVADGITAAGGSAVAWAFDVSDKDRIKAVVAEVAERFGGLDIVINNAGISAFCPIDDEDHYDLIWDRAVNVLLTSHQRIIRAALPHLRRSKAARIVNIASTEALGATNRDSPYSAAKAGVTGLTRALAVELGRGGITVNCICPGPIHTGMTSNVPDADK
ncbi:MAG TPA: SDR family NAD(P)-dependent oxidoreductase, partial [Phenylobacterium sp.]|nr:SDR family NAD(P)-dependent oxidoreductase [Phenylobacterium sp.]